MFVIGLGSETKILFTVNPNSHMALGDFWLNNATFFEVAVRKIGLRSKWPFSELQNSM